MSNLGSDLRALQRLVLACDAPMGPEAAAVAAGSGAPRCAEYTARARGAATQRASVLAALARARGERCGDGALSAAAATRRGTTE